AAPVVPVIVIERVEDAVPLAKALVSGGLKVLEVTLRTPAALDAIRAIDADVEDAILGVGTVTNAEQLRAAVEAGAKFAISPGLTPGLLEAKNDFDVPLIPGIATISEMMLGIDAGLKHFKFFPASMAGGPPMLKAFAGPFPDIRFCPTGGINEKNFLEYLTLSNVLCVGGSWVSPAAAAKEKDWATITRLSRAAVDAAANR
ncbi:MAG TPA: bifunctional 4-hydroxy-2-oxoglutarate aldolase/2-dehydro-3-deoxy-phosphogluconate aldolase, partial [Gammaproteobacteria bacterium]